MIHRGNLEKLARRGTASVAGAACSAVFGVLLVLIVTNGFPPALAGTLFAATSVFLILESVILLGTDTGLVKVVPAQLAGGRPRDLPRTLAVAAAPVLASSLVAAVLLHQLAPSLAGALVGADDAAAMSAMLRALAVVLPVAALHDLAVAATRGTGTMRPTVVVENLGRLGLQALAVLGVHLAGGGPAALALAWCLPYVVGLAAGGLWLRSLVTARTASGPPATPWRSVAREFWAFTAPRAVARVTQTALKRSDIVLVAALASPTEAALYTAATRLIVVGQLFVQAVQQALSPHVSALFARGDAAAAGSVFQAATTWSVLAAWPFFLTLAGFSPLLMGLFGAGYAAASDVVVILALTMLLATACGPVDAVLLMAGRSWLSLRNSTVALAVNIGLNLVLIPLDGIRGAAIAWSVAIVVRNLLPLRQVRRDLRMWPVTPSAARVCLLAVACFGAVDLVVLGTDLAPPADAGVLAVGVLVQAAAVWRWRGPLGLEAFRAVVRPRRPADAPAAAPA
ncbi:polysaccharide biosynthesis C-terminal domain-containing protein [Nocardioides dongkuii]|uniref:polysaccharide biosynthesis C-terminal domain-containing protein n=1 Tax=Nocardioides dongkuii TaxID=2760089 RepID=UPI0015FDF212|nr:polysaccharide biosynthesis C-terminal domain-containing protein [Nocardioides dongkuii]